jgi:hypothetical protein
LGGGGATGLQHLHQDMDRGHTTTGYMFSFLTIKDNTGTSPEVVEQVPKALSKFSTPSIADPTIKNWIRSVCEDVAHMIRRYKIELISLVWGHQFWHAELLDPPPESRVPSDGVRNPVG